MLEATAVRRVTTPEGVVVPFEIAPLPERLAAFLLDVAIIHLVVIAAVLAWSLAAGPAGYSAGLLASFFLRNFYFTGFELRRAGQTPGKRVMGLRVISRDGGPLTVEALFARNLTRDLEFFLPLQALTMPDAIIGAGPGWGMLLACGWLAAFALLPLFNREHLRCGDLVGGTVVIKSPPVRLLGDLVAEGPPTVDARATSPERVLFTEGQLDLYGVHELQTLETVLRSAGGYRHRELVGRVAEAIKTKIRWPRQRWDVDDDRFLLDFYKAQRAHLERRMLLGERRERKRD